MKVLHLIDTLGLGGAQTIVKYLFEHWNQGHELSLYALRKKEKELTIEHPDVWINPSTAKYSLSALDPLRKIIREQNIDCLHCHLFKSEVVGYLLKSRTFKDIKLIFHEHGQIVGSDNDSKIEDMIYVKFKQKSIAKADLNIAVSGAMANKLNNRASISESKIRTLLNFVDIEKFSPENLEKNQGLTRKELNIAADAFIVGFAGRIIKRKGWRTFIKAANLLHEKGHEIHFLIAGDGGEKELLEAEVASTKRPDLIHVLGRVENMLAFYSATDVFAMPSHFEGLPMSQLEVMSAGVPLLTTDGPGMDEIPEDKKSALFFEMYSEDDLAEKILWSVNNPAELQRIVETAKERASEFNLQQYIKKLSSIYDELH